jgi:uncharacterized protein
MYRTGTKREPVVMRECKLVAIGLEAGRSEPVMLLQELGSPEESAGEMLPEGRILPIWIGLPEAGLLESEQLGVPSPRPTTHRLMASIVSSFGRSLQRVQITALDENVFMAELVFDGGTVVSARPSDAVALALHLEVPVLVDEHVLDEAAVPAEKVLTNDAAEVSGGAGSRAGGAPSGAEIAREMAEFRDFLDDVEPEDFEKGN